MGAQVLIACEASQVLCAAFRQRGIEAYSCDIEPCYGGHPEWHIMADARQVVQGYCGYYLQNGAWMQVGGRWSLIIAHPPCTMLTHASAVRFANGTHSMFDVLQAANFFLTMLSAPCPMVAVEHPAPMKVAQHPPYDQINNPYDFGHKFSKRWCLWLRGLPPLLPTRARVLNHVPFLKHCAGNSRRRSHSFMGVAQAMAEQWGGLL